jgi:predicted RNA binding protein YcfA (HicA-like mRNA interferase family)
MAADAHIFAHCGGAPTIPRPTLETNRSKVAARLLREGWEVRHGRDHDVYKHSTRSGRIILPRHRTLSPGVARAVAKQARWRD